MKTLIFLSFCFSVGSTLVLEGPTRFSDYADHECSRVCTPNSLPLVCEYTFTVETYHTMSKACNDCPFNLTDCYRPHCVPAQGTSRFIMTVNRMLPGPSLQVCKGDTIIVHVANRMLAQSTTIHWHGIHQRTSPHHDGVSMVTQCPIPPGNTFTYRFKASPSGTHYWHAHVGIQRSDGLFGTLIVRDPEDPHSGQYDHDLPEHLVFIQDWLIEMTPNRFTGHHHSNYDNKPKSAIINGMGAYEVHKQDGDPTEYYTPRKVFNVDPGKRYRFRLISNAIFNCPLKFSIDNHTITVIASDGRPFDPYQADALVLFAGERYDFVLETMNDTSANYWMRLHGLADCSVRQVRQEAELRYRGAPAVTPAGGTTYQDGDRQGRELNPLNSNMSPDKMPILHLNNSYPDEESPEDKWDKPEADVKFYLGFDFNKIDNEIFHDPWLYPIRAVSRSHHLYSPQINYISNAAPPVPPLTQFRDIPQEMFCTADGMTDKRCNETYCECIHLLKVPLGAVAELILVDNGVTFHANHPFHLHGYSFRVVAMERVKAEGISTEEVKLMDQSGEIRRKLDEAVQKDTVTVPDGGYTVVRFHATNPGFWLLHCHITFHAEIGMAAIVQVGEVSDMPRKPTNFPRCGDWGGEEEEPTGPTNNPPPQNECPTSAPTSTAGSAPRTLWLTGFSVIIALAVTDKVKA